MTTPRSKKFSSILISYVDGGMIELAPIPNGFYMMVLDASWAIVFEYRSQELTRNFVVPVRNTKFIDAKIIREED